MKVLGVDEYTIESVDYYGIIRDDGSMTVQRRHPKTASDTPMSESEEILCALCAFVIREK